MPLDTTTSLDVAQPENYYYSAAAAATDPATATGDDSTDEQQQSGAAAGMVISRLSPYDMPFSPYKQTYTASAASCSAPRLQHQCTPAVWPFHDGACFYRAPFSYFIYRPRNNSAQRKSSSRAASSCSSTRSARWRKSR